MEMNAVTSTSIAGFPAAFRDLVIWQTAGGLSLVPLAVMLRICDMRVRAR